MIFLSHNSKDKPVIEPIALRLYSIFGQENVFYDSWSIQPGDGTIDKMDSGLEECHFFFLFVSRNSLSSEMVKLEWQNALIKAVHGELRIIPVRMDTTLIPPILAQTLYLDLYTNGIEAVLKQMVDVILGRNIFIPRYSEFSNLKALITQADYGFDIDIVAEHYMEPRSHYIVLMNCTSADADVRMRGAGMMQGGYYPDINLESGIRGNGWLIGISQATIPGFPLGITVNNKASSPIKVLAILHEKEKDRWDSIPILPQ